MKKKISILTKIGLAAAFLSPPIFAQSNYATPYTFTTLAGVGPGSTDANGSAARFGGPFAVAVDSSGNIYVADSGNHTIRKITPAGIVNTLAGSPGNPGSADGAGSVARFKNPEGIAVDGSGNAYVADSGNSTVRMITPGGIVSTLAGNPGQTGSADGTGTAALFSDPVGVTVDSNGIVYVADPNNNNIRKIASGGVVTTLTGSVNNRGSSDGNLSTAQFNAPFGLAVDNNFNLYVVDSLNSTIRKIAPDGTVSTLAGSAQQTGYTDGTGSVARFFLPRSLAVNANGIVYVADFQNDVIRMITPGGTVTTLAGSPRIFGSSDGIGSAARFNYPFGVAADAFGNVYVADTNNCTIRKISSGGSVTTLAGSPSPGSNDGTGTESRFDLPLGTAVDANGNVYIADTSNQTIRKIAPGGVVTTFAGSAGNSGNSDGTGSTARFNAPNGLAVDSTGNIYVADTLNNSVRMITPTGVVTTLATGFNFPTAVALDGNGNVYVADSHNGDVRKIAPGGVVTTVPGSAGSTDAVGLGYSGSGVAVDLSGNVYTTYDDTVRMITPTGVATTLAGSVNITGDNDGTGSAARFNFPTGLTVDKNGNLFVADLGNNTVRKVTSGGVVTTLAGRSGIFGSSDGTGSAVLFSYPAGIALDAGGNLYVADYENNTVRLGTPTTRTPQTITFNPVPDQTLGSAPVALAATDDSGAPIIYSVLAGPATITGNLMTFTGTGSVNIEASQDGTPTYGSAASTQTFDVQPAPSDTPLPPWMMLVLGAGMLLVVRWQIGRPKAL